MIKTLLIFLTLILSLTLNAQLVTCPPSIEFKNDSSFVSYSLQTSGNTEWKNILNIKPNPTAKEGYQYDEWIPLNTNIKPISDFLTTFLGTQYRSNPTAGTVEMQAYYCVYVINSTAPAKTESVKPKKN